MIFSEEIMARMALFVLGVAGFAVARRIHKSKQAAKPLVCPMRFDCNAVIHSDYSRFFGTPLEIFGMIYYSLVSLGYLVLIFVPGAIPEGWVNLLALISLLAFIFSLYLIGVQIFILKKGCSWCMVSALICFLIFLLTLYSYDFSAIMQNLIG